MSRHSLEKDAGDELESRVCEAPRVGRDIIIVRDFLNHRVDVRLMDELGDLMAWQWENYRIDYVLTAPSSGICPAYATALHLDKIVPVIYAKDSTSAVVRDSEVYHTEVLSATRGTTRTFTVVRELLPPGSKVLIVDDFLACGNAALGLAQIVRDAQCELVGIQVVIEKPWQNGRETILKQFPEAEIHSLCCADPVSHETSDNQNN